MLDRLAIPFAVMLLLAGWPSSPADACSCKFLSTDERAEGADAVFEGTIVAVQAPIEGGTRLTPFEFEVIAAWKGVDVGDRIIVYSAVFGSTCGATFEDASDWIVFAHRSDGTEGMSVPAGELGGSPTCGGAVMSENGARVRDELDGTPDAGCTVGRRDDLDFAFALGLALLGAHGRRRRFARAFVQQGGARTA